MNSGKYLKTIIFDMYGVIIKSRGNFIPFTVDIKQLCLMTGFF